MRDTKTKSDYDPMEVYYQRRCVKYVYVVPEGLRELMSDISREVLRTHPKHVYSFIADYLESLIVTRENIKVAARFVDDLTSTGQFIAELARSTGAPPKVVVAKVVVIQRYFRNYLRKKYLTQGIIEEDESPSEMLLKCLGQLKVSKHKANLAAIVIQRAYRRYKEMIENLENAPTTAVDWKLASRNTFSIFSKTKGVQYWELNMAARKIQAAYKGYYARRKIREFMEQQGEEELQNEEMSGLLDFAPVSDEEDPQKFWDKHRDHLMSIRETKEFPVQLHDGNKDILDSSHTFSESAELDPTTEITDYARHLFIEEDSKATDVVQFDKKFQHQLHSDVDEDTEMYHSGVVDLHDIADMSNIRIDMQFRSDADLMDASIDSVGE